MKGCQYAIHCAALTSSKNYDQGKYIEANVETTRNILDVALDQNIIRYIHIGTANSFSHCHTNSCFNEMSTPKDWTLNSGYIYSKYKAQQLVDAYIQEKGLPGIILNPTFIIGSGGKQSSGKIFDLLKYPVVLIPKGGKNFVDVDDVVKTIIKSFDLGDVGHKYILGGIQYVLQGFFYRIFRSSQYT